MVRLQVDKCSVFCFCCNSQFVILNRLANDHEYYVCMECRQTHNDMGWDSPSPNTFDNKEVEDYIEY